MKLKLSIKHVLNSTVPISRFNKGEAEVHKIFDEEGLRTYSGRGFFKADLSKIIDIIKSINE